MWYVVAYFEANIRLGEDASEILPCLEDFTEDFCIQN